MVIDPIIGFLGDTDSHRNAEVRGVLAPLAKLAEKHQAAVEATRQPAVIYRQPNLPKFAPNRQLSENRRTLSDVNKSAGGPPGR